MVAVVVAPTADVVTANAPRDAPPLTSASLGLSELTEADGQGL